MEFKEIVKLCKDLQLGGHFNELKNIYVVHMNKGDCKIKIYISNDDMELHLYDNGIEVLEILTNLKYVSRYAIEETFRRNNIYDVEEIYA